EESLCLSEVAAGNVASRKETPGAHEIAARHRALRCGQGIIDILVRLRECAARQGELGSGETKMHPVTPRHPLVARIAENGRHVPEMYRGAREIATRQREVRKIGLRVAHQFRKDLQRAQLLRKLDATLVILFRRIKCSQLAEYPTTRVPHAGSPDFFTDRF